MPNDYFHKLETDSFLDILNNLVFSVHSGEAIVTSVVPVIVG